MAAGDSSAVAGPRSDTDRDVVVACTRSKSWPLAAGQIASPPGVSLVPESPN